MNARYLVLGSILTAGLMLGAACDDAAPLGTGGNTGTGNSGAGNTGNTGGGGSTSTGEVENNCTAYCTAIEGSCIDDNQQYPDRDDCMTLCEFLPRGQKGDTSGNSVSCRAHFLAFADDSPDDAYTHCRTGGPFTEGQCTSRCNAFCAYAQEFCSTMDTMQWPSEEACRNDCEDWKNDVPYFIGAEGDNFGCRAKYLVMAGDAPLQNCQHIKQTDLCVDPIGPGGMGGMGGIGGMGGMMGGMGGIGGMMGGMGGIGGVGGVGGN